MAATLINCVSVDTMVNKSMKQITEYITTPLIERQQHLKLNEPCIERGGQSMYLKGLLAHILDTTIPAGHKIHVCHACHNSLCSNPNHLYWGTPSENAKDRDSQHKMTVWDRMVVKYGLEEARKLNRRNSNSHGTGNKGKPLSDEHKKKISESLTKK